MTTNGQVIALPERTHAEALAALGTKRDKVQYACRQLPEASTAEVLAWLHRHGVVSDPTRERSRVSTVVNEYRREHGGSQPAVFTEQAHSSREQINTVAGEQAERSPAQSGQKITVNTNVGQEEHAGKQDGTADRAAENRPDGATGFYAVAVLALVVSVDTSWRFFGTQLGITNTVERAAMFAVVESALIACGFAMRAGVRRNGHPGPARLVAWSLCGLSGYMALALSGLVAGLARVALGPLLSLVMLHLALGIELRARRGEQVTNWTQITRELRERCLSRLGLSDDGRDALARTRDRAARRAARLAAARVAVFRHVRLGRALRLSNVAHNSATRSRMLAELASAQHARTLRTLRLPSPWTEVNSTAEQGEHHGEQERKR